MDVSNAKTDIADAPSASNMRTLGFICLIHLNADGGDGGGITGAASEAR
jgi:hypothetical protein